MASQSGGHLHEPEANPGRKWLTESAQYTKHYQPRRVDLSNVLRDFPQGLFLFE